jgi:hypothetical protein
MLLEKQFCGEATCERAFLHDWVETASRKTCSQQQDILSLNFAL